MQKNEAPKNEAAPPAAPRVHYHRCHNHWHQQQQRQQQQQQQRQQQLIKQQKEAAEKAKQVSTKTLPAIVDCRCGSRLIQTNHSAGAYARGWVCDGCRTRGRGLRHACLSCQYDVCAECHRGRVVPAPKPVITSAVHDNNNTAATTSNLTALKPVHRFVVCDGCRGKVVGNRYKYV